MASIRAPTISLVIAPWKFVSKLAPIQFPTTAMMLSVAVTFQSILNCLKRTVNDVMITGNVLNRFVAIAMAGGRPRAQSVGIIISPPIPESDLTMPLITPSKHRKGRLSNNGLI